MVDHGSARVDGGETGPVRVDRLHLAPFQGLVDERVETVGLDVGGGTGGHLPATGDPQRDDVTFLADVLVDERVGEPRQRRHASGDPHLHLGPVADPVEDPVGESHPVAATGHARTPTLTLENRAGAAECPVCATCIGWPFPQFGVPQWTHSDSPASRSIVPQNCGVIPV